MAPTETQDLPPNNSLWAEGFKQSGKRKEFNNSYDVAIIGGGFSGLWSAYHLLKLDPKLSIVIFEAKSTGYGASGRIIKFISFTALLKTICPERVIRR